MCDAIEAERGFDPGFDAGVAPGAGVEDAEGIACLAVIIASFTDCWILSLLIVYIEYIMNNSITIVENDIIMIIRCFFVKNGFDGTGGALN